jgi:uncharacterized protein YecE (DUF72 family)
MAVYYGTGSWTDDAYVGTLYPPKTPASDRLRRYADIFDFVEVNSTYYATPSNSAIASWVKQTRPGFLFHLKLHRAASQNPQKAALRGNAADRLLKSAAPLIKEKRLGVFFLVLPPTFAPGRHTLTELDGLTERLKPHPLAVELRHSSWIDGAQRDETMQYFRDRKLVWIAVDMPRVAHSTIMPVVDAVTHPSIAYLRLHGRNRGWLTAKSAAERHHYPYKAKELTEIRRRVRTLSRTAKTTFVVANNHAEDFAPKAALALMRKRPPQ